MNKDTLLKHHPTVHSLLRPMFEPVSEAILRPQTVLASGSGITLGLTEEQKDNVIRQELGKARIEAMLCKQGIMERELEKATRQTN